MTARDGARLACWDFGGEGRPLFMVHGTGLHGRCWAPVAGPLSTLGFRPLALDMRGHGASSRSPNGDYRWDLFVLDVLDALAQLGLSDGAGDGGAPLSGVVAIGHSAGGTALLLAESSRQGTFSRILGVGTDPERPRQRRQGAARGAARPACPTAPCPIRVDR